MRVRVRLDEAGVLRELYADGHAGFAVKGQDVVCAAASALLLTAARTFEAGEGIGVEGSTNDSGALSLVVTNAPPNRTEWCRGVTEMFMRGIRDMAARYPDRISLNVTED